MLSFARDIRLLFRDSDVEAMRYVFDLGRYEDVKANAEGIYERVADGSMPCDEACRPTKSPAFVSGSTKGVPHSVPGGAHGAKMTIS